MPTKPDKTAARWPSHVTVYRPPGHGKTQIWEMDSRGRATGNLLMEVSNVRDARRLLTQEGYFPDVPGSISNWSKTAHLVARWIRRAARVR
jgi:hypothetical protein